MTPPRLDRATVSPTVTRTGENRTSNTAEVTVSNARFPPRAHSDRRSPPLLTNHADPLVAITDSVPAGTGSPIPLRPRHDHRSARGHRRDPERVQDYRTRRTRPAGLESPPNPHRPTRRHRCARRAAR